MKAVTIDTYGMTTRVMKGDYDRAKKILKINEIYYYKEERKEQVFIRKINVNNTRLFTKPILYRTNFKHEELKDCVVIEEEKKQ